MYPSIHDIALSQISGLEDGFIASFDSLGVFPKWSTYFGSTSTDRFYSLAFDSNDNLFITGLASSSGFPIATPGGSYNLAFGGAQDAFIAKFNNNDSLLWSTFYGGSSLDWGSAIKCDNNDNVFIQGGTYSNNFPTLNPGNGAFIDSTFGGSIDNFLVKFSSINQREWSTLIGGSGDEIQAITAPLSSNSIDFDSQNNIYIVGTTPSSDFPVLSSTGFFDSTNTTYGGYIMKFSAIDNSRALILAEVKVRYTLMLFQLM